MFKISKRDIKYKIDNKELYHENIEYKAKDKIMKN